VVKEYENRFGALNIDMPGGGGAPAAGGKK